MRVMVLYVHPLDDSCNAALHRTVVTALRESGHEADCKRSIGRVDTAMRRLGQ